MKPIVIYSPYECLIKTKNEELILDQNESALLDNCEEIDVYPTGKTKRYAFKIDLADKDNQFYSVIERQGKLLVFLIDGLISQNTDIFHFSYNNIDSEIALSGSSITFSTKNHRKQILLNSKPVKVQSGNFKHIDYIILDFPSSSQLICYNIKNNSARQFAGDKITTVENGFKILSSGGIYDHVEEELFVDKDGLKSKNKTFSPSNQIYPAKLVPYQFICAVKNGDSQTIKGLLSDSLASKLSPEQVLQYFGKISYFYMLDYKTCFAISNNENVIYEFYLNGDKIDDILDNKD